ncbi:MAG: hypothetical protein K8U57_30040 [Planctomycetes bacterium]|nr:hypothetical protein [Planctomycetota bacterium]
MTSSEWLVASDPAAMIDWLSQQGYDDALWQFAIECCRRVWHELPNESFRNVVNHAEDVGAIDIDERLSEAHRALEKLERRFHKSVDEKEQVRVSREMGYGNLVLAFDHQDAASVATVVSEGLVEWAEDGERECQMQAQSLRQLVADPTQAVFDDEVSDE